ncbi:hypothetical protein HRbin41_01324 [bacterium HR41]|nr:hypothetical protein HRbin41_01324 [bacterium HR41]
MHNVREGLDDHKLVDGDGAVLAHTAEVVAREVDEHHVFGPLLLVGEQLAGNGEIALGGTGARPCAGDRALRHPSSVDGDERLR